MQLIRNEELLYSCKRINLDISEISHGLLDSEWNMENLCANFTRVYFPISGEAFLTVREEKIPLVPGNIYIVPSGLNFSGFCPHKMDKLYVHLTLTRPDGSDIFAGIKNCLILHESGPLIRQAVSLYDANDFGSVLKFKLLLYEILERALEHCPAHALKLQVYSELTKAALNYIDTHLHASLTIDDIASALFVSKLVLQKKFKADLEKPIGKYLDDCLLLHAERALLDPTRSIKDISEQLGFCDQFYFSRKFSAAYGISPRRFRQLHNV